MPLTRRQFLASTLASAAAPLASPAFGAAPAQVLRAAPATWQLAPPDYPATPVWAYNGIVPGPELRHRQGEMFAARLENALPEQATTIHWHGLRLPNDMDGVPGFGRSATPPGESFDYRFPLRDAGTFWYHPHASSLEQVSRGLSGVLVVEEADPPDIDADLTLVLDDWRMTETAALHAGFGAFHDLSHAGRLGNYVTVNGGWNWTHPLRRRDRARLRLVNTATARIFDLRARGMTMWLIALDGMPLETPQPVTEITLAPAQRADVVAEITGADESLLTSREGDEEFMLARFPTSGPARPARAAPAALPPNDLPALDLAAAQTVTMVMEGGAMRWLASARHDGVEMDTRALADAGQFWAFNGTAGMPENPLATLSVGETCRITLENRTAFPHGQHLHGHHFRAVGPSGRLGPWRDTILLNAGETREIAFTAEEPGDWMFHCHMLSHQMAGMMTWIRVV